MESVYSRFVILKMSLHEHYLVGWLFLGLTVFWDSISVYIGPSPKEREKEKRKDRGEKKMSKQPPPVPTASTIGPCPTIIQTCRTPRQWKFTQHLRSTQPPLYEHEYDEWY